MVPIDVGTGGDSSQKGPKSGPGDRFMGLVAARIWVKSQSKCQVGDAGDHAGIPPGDDIVWGVDVADL